MTIKYYKTTNTELVEAMNNFVTAKKQLFADADAWAEQFNAEAAIWTSSNDLRIARQVRLKDYNSRNDLGYWSRREQGLSHPLALSNKRIPDKTIAKELNEKFISTLPQNNTVSKRPMYDAMGINWGDLLFNELTAFLHNGVAYIATSLKLKCEFDEIVASEYEAVELERNKDK